MNVETAIPPPRPPVTNAVGADSDGDVPEILKDMALRETRPEEIERIYQRIRRARGGEMKGPMFLPEKIHYRVLVVDPQSIQLICIEDPSASDEPFGRSFVEDMLSTRAWIVADREPLDVLRTPEARLTEKQILCRNRNVEIIQPLIDLGDEIFVRAKRAKVIGEICEARKLQPVQVGRILRRFLQGGMRQQALAGRWYVRSEGVNRGIRLAANGTVLSPSFVRAGRPRNDGYAPFRVVQLDVKKIQRGAVKNYHTPEGGDWTYAWLRCLGESYLDLDFHSSVPLKLQVAKYKASDFPSKTQFRYWAIKDKRIERLLKKRVGKKGYNLNYRPLNSKSELSALGSGYRFQIDPTPLDIVVVHRLTRRPIGKIILYIVVDVFSHAIAGFYVHVGNAGFDPACIAVLSGAEDKVELCKSFGIPLTGDEWPIACLPGHLIADSELASLRAHGLVDKNLLSLRIVPAYRADLKGLIEALLGAAAKRATHLPGYSKGGRKRASESPDVTAMLDYFEVSQIVIGWIRRHNNRVMAKYALTAEMIADGVVPTPINIWKWGVVNRGGARRKWDMETLRKLCLPTAKATITRRGLEWNGLVLEPLPGLLPEFQGWCEMRADGHEAEVDIIYHPADNDQTWLLHEGKFVRLRLNQVSSAMMHWTEEEIAAKTFESGLATANYASVNTPLNAAIEAQEMQIVSEGAKKTVAARGSTRERRREKVDKPAQRADQQKKIKGQNVPPPASAKTAGDILDEEEQEILRELEIDTQPPAPDEKSA